MSRKIKSILIVLTVVAACTAGQAVWAADCTETVIGTVTTIDNDKNAIVVEGLTVKGVPLVYLADRLNIVLVEGVSYVEITAHLCPLADNKVRACTLSVDGGPVINLPGN